MLGYTMIIPTIIFGRSLLLITCILEEYMYNGFTLGRHLPGTSRVDLALTVK